VSEDSNPPSPPDAAKLWGGRFGQTTSPIVDAYTSSLAVDRRIALEDVRGSIAHARMLATQGIIPAPEAEEIMAGLLQVREEIEQGRFEMNEQLEDVHMNIEARLTQIIGAAAGRLHTARSSVSVSTRSQAADGR
jgi:argininosuccinate lyase